jgi:alanine dehydrogenase
MVIGTPRETHWHEHRVGLTPFGVTRLVRTGHTVLVEKDAGTTAHFTDENYQGAGAQIVYESEEVYGRSDIVCRVGPLSLEEIAFLKPGIAICGFHHLAIMSTEDVKRLMELEATLIGYEIVRDERNDLPVLNPMSELAGQMAIHAAAHLLQNESRGRGILLGSVPGVPPPTVLVLGAGTVGRAAVRQALASGAHVIVLDEDLRKLRLVNHEFSGRAVTVMAGVQRLEYYTAIADVVVGAVLIPGARAPFVVTEAMVQTMKEGSVIIDVSIDQGGCVETSRPTTLLDPTFIVHGVVHYCVPNMTANVARSASRALATAAMPYVMALAARGVDEGLRADPGLASGVYLYRGKMVNRPLGETLGIPVSDLAAEIGAGGQS